MGDFSFSFRMPYQPNLIGSIFRHIKLVTAHFDQRIFIGLYNLLWCHPLALAFSFAMINFIFHLIGFYPSNHINPSGVTFNFAINLIGQYHLCVVIRAIKFHHYTWRGPEVQGVPPPIFTNWLIFFPSLNVLGVIKLAISCFGLSVTFVYKAFT